ncbi:hypothetical protein EFQ99_12325 [Rhizobium vallis]|uniref:Uncharacterized protein n=1 Tax=Rhizobium vallis TaxID=634290 RepID=A0A3S0SC75_9HYPH|nr:hypothetical protein [Rhizobium vallis]RUM25523.1 hypothetical protein EFQ99_12325 [Rhizobium vallis]
MRSKWLVPTFFILLATALHAADDKAQPPYFASILAHPIHDIQACYTSILARDGFDSPSCVGTLWQIWFAQDKAKVERIDFHDKTGFKEMLVKLIQAGNEKPTEQKNIPQTQEVISNIDIVVDTARSKLSDDNVSQCLAEIRYQKDLSSPYCDYTLALLNLALFTATDIPRIRMQREDLAAVLEQALPVK